MKSFTLSCRCSYYDVVVAQLRASLPSACHLSDAYSSPPRVASMHGLGRLTAGGEGVGGPTTGAADATARRRSPAVLPVPPSEPVLQGLEAWARIPPGSVWVVVWKGAAQAGAAGVCTDPGG